MAVREDEIGTVEREYPNASPLQKSIYHLQELWSDYQLWQEHETVKPNIKWFGTPDEIKRAGDTYIKSLQFHLKLIDGADLNKALAHGELTAADLHIAQQIKHEYEAAIRLKAPKKTAYQLGLEAGVSDGSDFKPSAPKPQFMKSLLSDTYREQYMKGYKVGHATGLKNARAKELKTIKDQTRDRHTPDRER